jgi:hypothetical protein
LHSYYSISLARLLIWFSSYILKIYVIASIWHARAEIGSLYFDVPNKNENGAPEFGIADGGHVRVAAFQFRRG